MARVVPAAAEGVDPTAPAADILAAVAEVLGKKHEELTVAVLDRPRHAALIAGSVPRQRQWSSCANGDIAGAIAVGRPGAGVDMLMGVGGTPEAVLAACALRCGGAEIFGRLYARDDEESRAAMDFGHDLDQVLTTKDLVRGENVFFAATGVTDGALLRGVRLEPQTVVTHSLSMRSRSGAVRVIETTHDRAQSNLIGVADDLIGSARTRSDRKAN